MKCLMSSDSTKFNRQLRFLNFGLLDNLLFQPIKLNKKLKIIARSKVNFSECYLNEFKILNSKTALGLYYPFLTVLKNLKKKIDRGHSISFFKLELVGSGYRAGPNFNSKRLFRFDIGFGHFFVVKIPSSVSVVCYRQQLIFFSSNNMHLNAFITHLRMKFRRPNAYKLKGFNIVGSSKKFKMVKRL